MKVDCGNHLQPCFCGYRIGWFFDKLDISKRSARPVSGFIIIKMSDLARQGIEAHARGEDTACLDLGNCGMTGVPEEIGECGWVEP